MSDDNGTSRAARSVREIRTASHLSRHDSSTSRADRATSFEGRLPSFSAPSSPRSNGVHLVSHASVPRPAWKAATGKFVVPGRCHQTVVELGGVGRHRKGGPVTVTVRRINVWSGAELVVRVALAYPAFILVVLLVMTCVSMGMAYVLGVLLYHFRGSAFEAFLAASTLLGLPVAVYGSACLIGAGVGLLTEVWSGMDVLGTFDASHKLTVKLAAFALQGIVPLGIMAVAAWAGSRRWLEFGLAALLAAAVLLFAAYLAVVAYTTFQATRLVVNDWDVFPHVVWDAAVLRANLLTARRNRGFRYFWREDADFAVYSLRSLEDRQPYYAQSVPLLLFFGDVRRARLPSNSRNTTLKIWVSFAAFIAFEAVLSFLVAGLLLATDSIAYSGALVAFGACMAAAALLGLFKIRRIFVHQRQTDPDVVRLQLDVITGDSDRLQSFSAYRSSVYNTSIYTLPTVSGGVRRPGALDVDGTVAVTLATGASQTAEEGAVSLRGPLLPWDSAEAAGVRAALGGGARGEDAPSPAAPAAPAPAPLPVGEISLRDVAVGPPGPEVARMLAEGWPPAELPGTPASSAPPEEPRESAFMSIPASEGLNSFEEGYLPDNTMSSDYVRRGAADSFDFFNATTAEETVQSGNTLARALNRITARVAEQQAAMMLATHTTRATSFDTFGGSAGAFDSWRAAPSPRGGDASGTLRTLDLPEAATLMETGPGSPARPWGAAWQALRQQGGPRAPHDTTMETRDSIRLGDTLATGSQPGSPSGSPFLMGSSSGEQAALLQDPGECIDLVLLGGPRRRTDAAAALRATSRSRMGGRTDLLRSVSASTEFARHGSMRSASGSMEHARHGSQHPSPRAAGSGMSGASLPPQSPSSSVPRGAAFAVSRESLPPPAPAVLAAAAPAAAAPAGAGALQSGESSDSSPQLEPTADILSVTLWEPSGPLSPPSDPSRPIGEHADQQVAAPTMVGPMDPPISVWWSSTEARSFEVTESPDMRRCLRPRFALAVVVLWAGVFVAWPLVALGLLGEWRLLGFGALTALLAAWELLFHGDLLLATHGGAKMRDALSGRDALTRRLHLVTERFYASPDGVFATCLAFAALVAAAFAVASTYRPSNFGVKASGDLGGGAQLYNVSELLRNLTQPPRPPNLEYPLCTLSPSFRSVSNLTALDLAFFASLPQQDLQITTALDGARAALSGWLDEPLDAAALTSSSSGAFARLGLTAVTIDWPRAVAVVVSVGQSSSTINTLQASAAWVPAVVAQLARALVPYGRIWDRLLPFFVDWAALKSEWDVGAFRAFSAHVAAIKSSLPSSRTLLLTGHGFAGALAAVAGAQNGVPAVTFSSPGGVLSHRRLGVDVSALDLLALNVRPDHDVIAQIDDSSRLSQRVACASGSVAGCHALRRTMCEVVDACGSLRRPVMLQQCAAYGYAWATAALALDPPLV